MTSATSPYLNRPLRTLAEARSPLLNRAASALHRALDCEKWNYAAWQLGAAADALRAAGERALADRASALAADWPSADAEVHALMRDVKELMEAPR